MRARDAESSTQNVACGLRPSTTGICWLANTRFTGPARAGAGRRARPPAAPCRRTAWPPGRPPRRPPSTCTCTGSARPRSASRSRLRKRVRCSGGRPSSTSTVIRVSLSPAWSSSRAATLTASPKAVAAHLDDLAARQRHLQPQAAQAGGGAALVAARHHARRAHRASARPPATACVGCSNSAIRPSPRVLTTRPPQAVDRRAPGRVTQCVTTEVASALPSVSNSAVLPRRSANRTVRSAICVMPRRKCSRRREEGPLMRALLRSAVELQGPTCACGAAQTHRCAGAAACGGTCPANQRLSR